jgi:Flp pilus assembly secretin CpaC
MVGGNPFSTTVNTNVTYVPIIVRFHSRRGVVLDPTKPACGDTVAISTRFFNSLLFTRQSITSNGQVVSDSAAKIATGDALPILTFIALSGVNAVSQQVQCVNVGVTLQIAPHVTRDGFVTSHIFCEVSSVTGVSQGCPTISQREATTSATVKDGESFVTGELTQENKLSTHSEVPILGDVPLLGDLFNLHRGTESKTDLIIVITPHIVRGPDSSAADLARSADNNSTQSNAAGNIVTPVSNATDETMCIDGGGAVVIENGNKRCFHFATAVPASPKIGSPQTN